MLPAHVSIGVVLACRRHVLTHPPCKELRNTFGWDWLPQEESVCDCFRPETGCQLPSFSQEATGKGQPHQPPRNGQFQNVPDLDLPGRLGVLKRPLYH